MAISVVAQQDISVGSTNSFTGQASITPSTVGDFLFAILSWWNTATGSQTGTVTAFSDSQGNVWTQIGTTQYTGSVHAGSAGIAMFYALAKAVTADSFSTTLSASFNNIHFNNFDLGPNV